MPHELFAKCRRQRFYGSGEGTGNSRDTSALRLNGHKRHKNGNRQVSNLILCRAFCKIRQIAGFFTGKGCDPRERGRPARTRLGRVVAIGFTGLAGSPAHWRRGSAFTRMRAGRPRSRGEIHGQPGADPSRAGRSLPLPPQYHARLRISQKALPSVLFVVVSFAKGSMSFDF